MNQQWVKSGFAKTYSRKGSIEYMNFLISILPCKETLMGHVGHVAAPSPF